MNRAEYPDQIYAINTYDATVGKTPLQNFASLRVVRMAIGGNQDRFVSDVEISVASGQTLILEIDRPRHWQFYDSQRLAVLIFHPQQAFVVIDQNSVIFVPGIVFDHCDDRVRRDEPRQVINVPIGVVADYTVAQPQDVRGPEVVFQILLDLFAVEMRVAVGIEQAGLGRDERAAPVDIQRTAFHYDAGLKEDFVHLLGDARGNYVVQVVRRIFIAPGVVAPIDDRAFAPAAAVAHDVNRTVVSRPGVTGWIEMESHGVDLDAARSQQAVDPVGEIGVGDVDPN